LLKCSSD
jgi:hypothetical protein